MENDMENHARNLDREGYSIPEASEKSGIGRTKLYKAISEGTLKARKCGKRTLILREELREYLLSLPLA
jgi:excisionase family DNA binding protein